MNYGYSERATRSRKAAAGRRRALLCCMAESFESCSHSPAPFFQFAFQPFRSSHVLRKGSVAKLFRRRQHVRADVTLQARHRSGAEMEFSDSFAISPPSPTTNDFGRDRAFRRKGRTRTYERSSQNRTLARSDLNSSFIGFHKQSQFRVDWTGLRDWPPSSTTLSRPDFFLLRCPQEFDPNQDEESDGRPGRVHFRCFSSSLPAIARLPSATAAATFYGVAESAAAIEGRLRQRRRDFLSCVPYIYR